MKKRPMNRKMLEYFARMAADAYMNDPVHARATKNEKIRRKYIQMKKLCSAVVQIINPIKKEKLNVEEKRNSKSKR